MPATFVAIAMKQNLTAVTLVVKEYDEAIEFFTTVLNFELIEDTKMSETKRWVVVRPIGSSCDFLLAKAVGDEQVAAVGRQTGGRVAFFLHTDDFWRDYNSYTASGVRFLREPAVEAYGTVSVFEDLYGNLWDLIGPGQD